MGKKVSAGLINWRGADLTANFYVGNFSTQVSPNDVKAGIEQQGVDVVELNELKLRHSRFKSFKLCIRKKDIDTIKMEEFWPEGVVLRKFFHRQNPDGPAITSS